MISRVKFVGAGAVAVLAVSAVSAAEIPYRKSVELGVGEQTVIHGARGKCGAPPPAWEDTRLPTVTLGEFLPGPVGTRRSRSCGGETPARAVIYKALKPGTESFELFGDPVKVVVR